MLTPQRRVSEASHPKIPCPMPETHRCVSLKTADSFCLPKFLDTDSVEMLTRVPRGRAVLGGTGPEGVLHLPEIAAVLPGPRVPG